VTGTRPFGVILAGGLSSRMGGGDKCLLDIDGETLLHRVIRKISPQVSGLVLNANGDAGRFSDYELPVVPDSLPDYPGPLAGVLAGMEFAREQGASVIATVAADTPFFPSDLVEQLEAGRSGQGVPLAMAVTPDPERRFARHPTFGLWPVRLADDLREALVAGTRKIVAWTDPHGCARVEFAAEPFDPFFNVNTPDDLKRAEEMIAEFGL
jgi:molybdenum cofactor guanylyltransferase